MSNLFMPGEEKIENQYTRLLPIETLELEQCIDRNPLTVSYDLSVLEAIALMGTTQSCQIDSEDRQQITPHRDRSCILVVKNNLLVGILTERDIVRLTSASVNLSKVKVFEVMSEQLVTLDRDREQTIDSALSKLQKHQIRHLPVVENGGQLLGLITLHSIRQALQPANFLKLRRVEEVMARSVLHAPPNTSILQLARLMAEHRISCVAILENNLPVGIVTERDIVQFQFINLNLVTTLAKEVMSAPLFCLKPFDSLWQVHQEMQRLRVRRLLVVGEAGELVGIVTQSDLFRVFDPLEMANIIKILQQQVEERTISLKQEINRRQESESNLQTARDRLERKVEKRTVELKRSSAIARSQLAEIESIYATAPIGLCFIDTDLRFVRINEHLAEINGLSVEEHIGHTLREILPEMANLLEPLYQQVIDSGKPIFNLEIKGTNRSQPGIERDWLVSLCPLTQKNGQVLGFNVTVQEITDRKQSEARLAQMNNILRAVIDGTKDVIFVKDLQGRYVVANKTAANWLNTSVEKVIDRDDTSLFPPEIARSIRQTDLQIIETKEMITYEEEVPKQGELRSLLSSKYPWLDEQGNVIGVIGISRDITDRKQSYVKLRQQKEELVRANRVKDEFLAILSHELRTPLNPILGWTQMLRKYQLDEQTTAKAIEAIERNAQQQVQLIDDLLDMSRILRGKLTLKEELVRLIPVITAAIETVRLAAQAKTIEIEQVLDASVGNIIGDAGRLQQVFWNLLSNAIKFTPSGGGVTVRLTQVDRYAQIQVSDTGSGISSDFLPHLFEAFRQQDASTTRKFGGLGLGLAIVRQLVESHGGIIRVDSPGERGGATFTVSLPLACADRAFEPNQIEIDSKPSLQDIRILAVDDETDSLELLTFILQQEGAIVVAVESATEALQAIEKERFDLLISDIGMSDLDGFMLLQQIRQMDSNPNANIPAIALTAYAKNEDREKALASGFQDFLSKPFQSQDLFSAIALLFKVRK
ncbi:MAG: CBS domain-containing protein [Xenococcaceae cyanobacterium]